MERCLRNALKAAAPVGSTSAWAEVTASGAGRLYAEQNFVLGGSRVYKGAIWGKQIGNPGFTIFSRLTPNLGRKLGRGVSTESLRYPTGLTTLSSLSHSARANQATTLRNQCQIRECLRGSLSHV